MEISIGELSRRTGVKVPTIRYYELIALMPAPPRSEGKQRRYSEPEVSRLIFIRHARELGFEIDAIRALLALQDNPNQPCLTADRIARARLAEVEQRIPQPYGSQSRAGVDDQRMQPRLCRHVPRDRGPRRPRLMRLRQALAHGRSPPRRMRTAQFRNNRQVFVEKIRMSLDRGKQRIEGNSSPDCFVLRRHSLRTLPGVELTRSKLLSGTVGAGAFSPSMVSS